MLMLTDMTALTGHVITDSLQICCLCENGFDQTLNTLARSPFERGKLGSNEENKMVQKEVQKNPLKPSDTSDTRSRDVK